MGLFKGPRVAVGDRAPDFMLASQSGEMVRLSEVLAERVVVVYFYPADETPVCTRESCAFRDAYEDFTEAGAEVIGISRDAVESHLAFAGRHRLPFLLLSDPDGEVHRRYGALALGGLMPRRVTFVIDREGVVRHRFSAMFKAQRHIDEALATILALPG